MSVIIGSARNDERGKASGGKAGDQTGNEVSTQTAYMHSKGWFVFRAKDPRTAHKLAFAMAAACANNNIGYDQAQNTDLYKVASLVSFNPGLVKTPTETDCARLVRVCLAYAGVKIPDVYTVTLPIELRKTGLFTEFTLTSVNELHEGDILVTKSKGHAAICTKDAYTSVTGVANEVITGFWSNGEYRKKALTAAGWDYEIVRARVNEILRG